jgi:hypothetical protein
MPGPHCGSAASLDNCGVRVPGVRDRGSATDAIPHEAGGGNGCRRLILT